MGGRVHGLDVFAQNRGRWQVLVNAVMNLWVPSYEGKFLSS